MDQQAEPSGQVERRLRVELGQLRLFAKAIGENDPIYFDEAAAKVAGLPAPLAPPTFAYSLGALAFGPETWSNDLGIDPSRLLHGEQSFEHLRPIYAYDEILLRRRVVDRYEKKGGRLEFVVVDTDALNGLGALCVRSRMTGVIKHP